MVDALSLLGCLATAALGAWYTARLQSIESARVAASELRAVRFTTEVRIPPSLRGCPHLRAPEPVTGLDGEPVGRWLCPTCLDEVPAPRPTVLPPACTCPPGEECEVVPLRLLDGTVVRYTRPCGGLLPAAPERPHP